MGKDIRKVIGDANAWFFLLLPVALVAVCVLLPAVISLLGALFGAMGDLGTAMKG